MELSIKSNWHSELNAGQSLIQLGPLYIVSHLGIPVASHSIRTCGNWQSIAGSPAGQCCPSDIHLDWIPLTFKTSDGLHI